MFETTDSTQAETVRLKRLNHVKVLLVGDI